MLDALVTAEGTPDTTVYAGKTLAERTTGRFYTPSALAMDLAAQVVAGLDGQRVAHCEPGRPVSICDPFCGDGRLVTALLIALAGNPATAFRRYSITLQDMDRRATLQAVKAVTEVARHLGISVEVRFQVGDSLAEAVPETHCAVITNPPWELLKPDSRETAGMDAEGVASFTAYLRARCAELDERFPDAKADVSWAGWGTNLARCGWDLALRSCRPGGILGIVLPSTILADQASESMRRGTCQRL